MSQFHDLVRLFIHFGNVDITIMHCKALYPCPTNLLNLSFIKFLQNYDFDIGYSGHHVGIWDAIYAHAFGATAIEKHITLDRSMYGSDQQSSVEEPGLRKMVEVIKFGVDAWGDGIKTITPEEQKVMDKLRYWE